MSHYGLLRDYQFGELGEDIRGAALYGSGDEKLGKIDDVIFNHTNGDIRYVVVDTGGWLTTKKFIVPTDRLRASSEHENDFASDLTKQQVESFPPYQEKDLDSHEKWEDYEGRYRSKWETGPVMHRAGTDRNITPTTRQMEGNQSSIRAAEGLPRPTPAPVAGDNASLEAAAARTDRIIPAGDDAVVIENSAVGIGGRYDTFQQRLRERRKQVASGCATCSEGPGTQSFKDSDMKKAG